MQNPLLVAFLGLGLSLANVPALRAQNQSADLVKQGVALYDAGKYEEAALSYQQAIKQDPQNFTARYELALTFNAMGRNAEAADLCKKLVKEDPEPSAQVYGTYGNALDGMKKPREAVKVYQEGLKRFPNDGSLYFNLGVTQATSLEAPADAMASMQQAVRCRPTHTNSLNALSLLTLQTGNRVPALLEMLRLLQLEPTGARATATLNRLDKVMGLGVQKTGPQAITININSQTLKNAEKKNEADNFSSADMLLSMSSALDHSEGNAGKTPSELLISKLTSLIGVLDELHPEKQPGFAWQYFVPYFVELKKQGHLPALAYTSQLSRADATPEVKAWLTAHDAEVEAYQTWAAAYIWPK